MPQGTQAEEKAEDIGAISLMEVVDILYETWGILTVLSKP